MLNVGHGRPFLMEAGNVAWVWKRPAMADIFNFENHFWVLTGISEACVKFTGDYPEIVGCFN